LNVVLSNKEAGPSKAPYILQANKEVGHFWTHITLISGLGV